MKYIIIGLGNYGGGLAEELMAIGHEVIGVDQNEGRVDNLKDKITTAFVLDATDELALETLPLREIDVDVGIVDVMAKNVDSKRVRKQLEVDFVVNQGSQRYYIQVAYDMASEEKQTQELNSLRNIPDSFKKIIIINGIKKPWRNDEGFVIMGMKYFLLNADSLEF